MHTPHKFHQSLKLSCYLVFFSSLLKHCDASPLLADGSATNALEDVKNLIGALYNEVLVYNNIIIIPEMASTGDIWKTDIQKKDF